MGELDSAPAMSPLTKRKLGVRPKTDSLRLSSKIIYMPSASAPDAVDFTRNKSPSQAGNEFPYFYAANYSETFLMDPLASQKKLPGTAVSQLLQTSILMKMIKTFNLNKNITCVIHYFNFSFVKPK